LLAAFYGDECRGIATPVRVLDQWVFFLTQYSNAQNQPLTYKIYWADSEEIMDVQESLPFVNNQILGNPLEPYTFHLPMATLSAPANVCLELVENQIKLSWESVAGAVSYKIFAADSPEGPFTDVSQLGSFARNTAIPSGNEWDRSAKVNAVRNSSERAYLYWSCEIPIRPAQFYYIAASTDIP
jgi:hypothetical protein